MVKRHVLSKRDRKAILEELGRVCPGAAIGREDVVEILEDEDAGHILLVNSKPSFFKHGDRWLPHLRFLLEDEKRLQGLSLVVVDRGAVKPLINGADLMVPGIKEIRGSFRSGDLVVVVDEDYFKPIVVGLALVDSELIVSGRVKRGKAVENVHRVGDRIWRAAP